jgi:hypothetical protein
LATGPVLEKRSKMSPPMKRAKYGSYILVWNTLQRL